MSASGTRRGGRRPRTEKSRAEKPPEPAARSVVIAGGVRPTTQELKSGDTLRDEFEPAEAPWFHLHRGKDLGELVRSGHKGYLRDPDDYARSGDGWQYGDPIARKLHREHDPLTRKGEPDAETVEESVRFFWLRKLEQHKLPSPELKSLARAVRSMHLGDALGWKALRERMVRIYIERLWKPPE